MTDNNETTPTVWVVNHDGQDIDHAQTFGRLKIITHGKINPFNVDSLIHNLHQGLQNSRPDDWIVPTGASILGILASLEMVRRHKRLNLLIWHARQRKYIPRIIRADFEMDFSVPFLEAILLGEDVPEKELTDEIRK